MVANDAGVGVRVDGRFNYNQQMGRCKGLYSHVKISICHELSCSHMDWPFQRPLEPVHSRRGSGSCDATALHREVSYIAEWDVDNVIGLEEQVGALSLLHIAEG